MTTIKVVQILPQCIAEASVVFCSGPSGDSEGVGGLSRHAKLTARQPGAHVLAGFTCVGQFKIVYSGRSVHGDAGQNAALDPIDQIRRAPGLDDMSTQCGYYGPAILVGAANVVSDPTESLAGQ